MPHDPRTVEQRVHQIIVEHLGVKPKDVHLAADLQDDLGADSLDLVELVMAVEEEFGIEIPDDEAEKCLIVRDIIGLVEQHRPDLKGKVRACRECGCTDHNACITDGTACHWVAADLCSACAPKPAEAVG